ncbi:hypothetical protein [Desulfocurvibacter africanus]|uniref:hypothetical protein n=1 Tax=Desulfocurvibacter africanus TaxID=873 RepID=UPI0003F76060|nr:hypothetical protein [Desulfocurvibacter africanus]
MADRNKSIDGDAVLPELMHLMDVRALLAFGRLDFATAMMQADRESKATRAELADAIKVDKSTLDRSFSFNVDDAPYFIRADKLPELAVAMKTDAVLRWLVGRWLYLLSTGGVSKRRPVNVLSLYHRLAEVAREYGDLAGKLHEYTAEDSSGGEHLTKSELVRLDKEAGDLVTHSLEIKRSIRLLIGELVAEGRE